MMDLAFKGRCVLKMFRLFVGLILGISSLPVFADSRSSVAGGVELKLTADEFISLYEEMCASGLVEYCRNLARFVERQSTRNQTVVARLNKTSLDIYTQRCDVGDPLSCQDVLTVYEVVNGQDLYLRDSQILNERLNNAAKRGCENRQAVSCLILSNWHQGTGSPEFDIQKAKSLSDLAVGYLEQDCRVKVAASCDTLGHRLVNGQRFGGFIVYDIERAINMFDLGCQHASAASCITLGNIYLQSFYVKKNKVKAVEYFQKGCDLNDAISCNNLVSVGLTVSGMKMTNEQKEALRSRVAHLARTNCTQGKIAQCSLFKIG